MSIFSWIKSWFTRKSLESYDLYLPSEKEIYRYAKNYDGTNIIAVDPMLLYKKIMAEKGDLWAELKVGNSIHPDAEKMYVKAVERIRRLFDVKTPEEGGLTCEQSLALFNHFMAFKLDVKKNLKIYQTLLKEMPDNLDSLLDASPPTSNTLDSGSIVKENITVELPSSPVELESLRESTPQPTTTSET